MLRANHDWQPRTVRCCDCGCALDVSRQAGMVTAGAAILPELPGAACEACLPLLEGTAVADFKADAAVHFIHATDFEIKTVDAVQVYLDLYGWEPAIVAAGAMRLHADGKSREAFGLLKAAREHGPAGYYDVERAALLLIDGETGQAHDLLAATTGDDHPKWHHWNGVLAHSVGRSEAAVEHWTQQIETHPEAFDGWLPLGFHLVREVGDYEAGEAYFRRACAQHPQHQEFRAWLGDALMRQGKLDEALVELEAARELTAVDPAFAAGIEELISAIRAEREGEG